MSKLISIVTPTFNEEGNIEKLCGSISKEMSKTNCDYEHILIDNSSTDNTIKILKELRDIGNTVIVVELDEKIMEQADQIIDIGPGAGIHGGEIIFQGLLKDIYKEEKSLTAKYLSGELKIPIPKNRRRTIEQKY